MSFQKIRPVISYTEFLQAIKEIKDFASTRGKLYAADGIMDEMLYFQRLNAQITDDAIDLKALYRAYVELDDYHTENFRPYVPRKHSPGRALLLRLQLIG